MATDDTADGPISEPVEQPRMALDPAGADREGADRRA